MSVYIVSEGKPLNDPLLQLAELQMQEMLLAWTEVVLRVCFEKFPLEIPKFFVVV
jgi:hypothetical protein